jgi:hypothetical protein
MVSGYPDWYRGSILFGIYNEMPKGINLDSAGNIVALLKGTFDDVPTILACDTDGNIKVNVQVNATPTPIIPSDPPQSIPITEQSPLTSIQVEPKTGMGNLAVTESSPLTSIQVEPKTGMGNLAVTESSPLTSIQVEPKTGMGNLAVTESSPLTSIQVEPKTGMGNLAVDVKASSVTIPTSEQSPLTSIQVEPKTGMGNLAVDVKASSVTIPTSEQSPLTSIQVEPKTGMGNLKVDINAQSLTPLSTNIKYSGGVASDTVTEIDAAGIETILTLTGSYLIQSIYIYANPSGTLGESPIGITIDGGDEFDFFINRFFTGVGGPDWGLPLDILNYFSDSSRYTISLKYPYIISDSLLLRYINNGNAQTNVRVRIHYFPI